MLVSDTQRRSAASDVAHEISEFRGAWTLHKGVPFAWTAWFVHARNLMRFFDGTQDSSDDILARHFFDPPGHWDSIRERSSPPSVYPAYELAAHKLAAHLTYGRSEYRKNGLAPSQEVTDYLLRLGQTFVLALPAQDQAWFDGLFT
jgi:hypothetical protein